MTTHCGHSLLPYDPVRVARLIARFRTMIDEYGLPEGGWIVSGDICGQRIERWDESILAIVGRSERTRPWVVCDPSLPPNTIMAARGD